MEQITVCRGNEIQEMIARPICKDKQIEICLLGSSSHWLWGFRSGSTTSPKIVVPAHAYYTSVK